MKGRDRITSVTFKRGGVRLTTKSGWTIKARKLSEHPFWTLQSYDRRGTSTNNLARFNDYLRANGLSFAVAPLIEASQLWRYMR